MADLFKKNTAEEAPVAVDANAEAPAPEAKGKKEKKSKVKYLEPNQMNFLEQYSIVVEGKKKNLDLEKVLKPLIALLIVVLAIFVLLEVVLLGMKAQTKSLEKYINDENNVATYNEALDTKAQTDTINLQKANLENVIKAIDSYPNVGTAFFKTIAANATANGTSVSNYSYSNENGYLSVSCTSTTTADVAKFVRAMEQNGLFANVIYTGFNGEAQEGYTYTLSCYCLGDANVEVPAEAPVEETPVEG